VEHVQAGLIGVDRQMEELFRARSNGTSAAQRTMLRAIAKLGGENLEHGAVAEALGQSTIGMSSIRHTLLEKGLIESEHYGRMSFQSQDSLSGFSNTRPNDLRIGPISYADGCYCLFGDFLE